MATKIQVTGFTDGKAAIGGALAVNTPVTLTDTTTGPAPVSRLWTIIVYPSPLASAPALSAATAASTQFTPTSDGCYLAKLQRKEATGVYTYAYVLVGVPDADGLVLPSPRVSPEHFNLNDAAKAAGWAGSEEGGTNVLLDAYLRWLKTNSGGGAVSYTDIQTACASATSPLGLNAERISNLADPVDAQDAATRAYVLANAGSVSRIVALDANDIVEWNLDETGAPWVDSISGVNLVGYDSGNPSYTPLISYGGSIFGARAPHVNWQLDTGLESAATIVGENDYGTIHGWLRPTYSHGGTVFQKNDPGSSGPYLRFGNIDSTSGAEVYAGIGNSGDIDMLPTPAKSRYRGLITVGQWIHVAMTWGGGEAFIYIDGVLLPTTITYSALGWNGGKWRLGKWSGNLDAHFSKWRVCNVARTAAYIDEVQRRATGRWP